VASGSPALSTEVILDACGSCILVKRACQCCDVSTPASTITVHVCRSPKGSIPRTGILLIEVSFWVKRFARASACGRLRLESDKNSTIIDLEPSLTIVGHQEAKLRFSLSSPACYTQTEVVKLQPTVETEQAWMPLNSSSNELEASS
jgi:hypothetical protein